MKNKLKVFITGLALALALGLAPATLTVRATAQSVAAVTLAPVAGQQTVGNQPFDPGIALTQIAAYDAAYKASMTPERLAYMALPYNAFTASSSSVPTRTTPSVLAQEAGKGGLDTQIQVWGDGPARTMIERIVQGYSWVPSFGQDTPAVGPGLSMAGVASYDPANPPAGSILVPKWDTSGFLILPLPYVPPPPTTPPAPVTMQVGPYEFSGINPLDGTFGYYYGVVGGTKPTLNQVVTSGTQTFTLVNYPSQSMIGNGQMMALWKLSTN